MKRVSVNLFLDGTVDRRPLWLAQTPQAFSVPVLLQAYEHARQAGLEATDDAALVEALGHPVRVVPGSRLNFKITTREDLALARLIVEGAPARRGAERERGPGPARRDGFRRPPVRRRARAGRRRCGDPA